MTIHLANTAICPPVALAPLAGITDPPFRRLAARFGAGLVVSEMVASREVVQAGRLARARAGLDAGLCVEPGTHADAGRAVTSVQLAGCDPHWMGEAARLVQDGGARIIDINMGCPARKVTSGWSGAALMRDLDHALRLIEAVVAVARVPVTLKMRLGWDAERLNAPELARRAEAAGVAMITVHGRTRQQFYKGRAEWTAIAPVRRAVGVPVLANGDIVDVATARAALAASGAQGVMVGRGAQGRPWLPGLIAHRLFGAPKPAIPSGAALADLVCEHYESMLAHYGAELGARVARKHLGWYMDTVGTATGLRREILIAQHPGAVLARLPDALAGRALAA